MIVKTLPALVLVLACASPQPPSDPLVATWSGGEVRRGEFDGWLNHRRARDTDENRLKELEQMLLVKTLATAASERGVDESGEFALLEGLLADEILSRSVLSNRVRAIEVSEREIDALVEQYPNAFQKPDRRQLRNILKRKPVHASAGEIELLREEMETLRRRVQAGEDFGELAIIESESQSRFRKGSMGVTLPGQLSPELEKIVWALDEKEVSEVFESTEGFTLIYCDRIPPPKIHSPEEVRQLFRANLRKQKVQRDQEEFLADLRQAAEIEIDLSSIDDPAAVLARYQGGSITAPELNSWLKATARRPLSVATLGEIAVRDQLLSLITKRLVADQGRALGLDRTSEVEQRVVWRRREALATREMAHRVQKLLAVPTEEEARVLFNENPARFRRRAEFEISVIRLEYARGDDVARMRTDVEARQLRLDLERNAITFEEAARRHSLHPSASAGGYLGWLPKPRVASFSLALGRAIDALDSPGLTQEVDDDGVYWIARLHAKKPERLTSFEEVREAVEQSLGSSRAKALHAGLTDELRSALELTLVGADEA